MDSSGFPQNITMVEALRDTSSMEALQGDKEANHGDECAKTSPKTPWTSRLKARINPSREKTSTTSVLVDQSGGICSTLPLDKEAHDSGECVKIPPKEPRDSRIKAWRNLTRKKTSTAPAPADQSDSILSRLPPEVRELIWEYVLAPPPPTKAAHFHIYDDVYDFCTYQALDWQQLLMRKLGTRSALLRTCRGIYEEAAQILYNDRDFELVVFAGRARPGCIEVDGRGCDNLKLRNRLGKVEKCLLDFTRVRRANIVVQPGTRIPGVRAYTKRIGALLEALDYGSHMKRLAVTFNFAAATDVLKVVVPVVRALFPLAGHGNTARREIPVMLYPQATTDECKDAITVLVTVLESGNTAGRWEPVTDDDYATRSQMVECVKRGAYGQNGPPRLTAQQQPPVTQPRATFSLDNVMTAIAGASMLIVALPVALPVAGPWWVGAELWRKRAKGEKMLST